MAGNNSIQFLRGTSDTRLNHSENLLAGQPFYETDTNELYIGTGGAINQAKPLFIGYDFVIRTQDQFDYWLAHIGDFTSVLLVGMGSDKQYKLQNKGIVLPNTLSRLDGVNDPLIYAEVDTSYEGSSYVLCQGNSSKSTCRISNIKFQLYVRKPSVTTHGLQHTHFLENISVYITLIVNPSGMSSSATFGAASCFFRCNYLYGCEARLNILIGNHDEDVMSNFYGFDWCDFLYGCIGTIEFNDTPYTMRGNTSTTFAVFSGCRYMTCAEATMYVWNTLSAGFSTSKYTCFIGCKFLTQIYARAKSIYEGKSERAWNFFVNCSYVSNTSLDSAHSKTAPFYSTITEGNLSTVEDLEKYHIDPVTCMYNTLKG